MAFQSDGWSDREDGMVFIPRGQVVHIAHPGGEDTTDALRKFALEWYSTKTAMVVQNSTLIGRMGNAVVKEVNLNNASSATSVMKVIKAVSAKFSRELEVL